MAVPTQLSDLSATAASNSPAGSDTVGTTMDDYIRALASIIARISAGTDALTTPALGTPTAAGRIAANLGLTVAGGTFVSRGISDAATAAALTLSGSGANSVTIANSATNPTIGTSAGNLAIAVPLIVAGGIQTKSGTATTAGGVVGFYMGSDSIGIYFGSGAPTVSAAKGSIYLRSDGTTTNNRMYVNTDGTTTWTAVTTVA